MKNKNPLYIVFGIGAGIIAYYLFCKKKDDAVAVVDGQADGQADGKADEKPATRDAILGGGSVTPQNPTIVPIVTPLVLSGTPTVQGKPPIRIINPSPTSVKVVPRPVPTNSFIPTPVPRPVPTTSFVPKPVPINSFIPTPAPRPVSVFTSPAPRPVSVFTSPVPRPVPTTSFVTRPTLTTAPIGVRPMTNIISRFDGFDGSSFEVGDCLNDL